MNRWLRWGSGLVLKIFLGAAAKPKSTNLLGSFFQVHGEHGVNAAIPLHIYESMVFWMGFANNFDHFTGRDVLEVFFLTQRADHSQDLSLESEAPSGPHTTERKV